MAQRNTRRSRHRRGTRVPRPALAASRSPSPFTAPVRRRTAGAALPDNDLLERQTYRLATSTAALTSLFLRADTVTLYTERRTVSSLPSTIGGLLVTALVLSLFTVPIAMLAALLVMAVLPFDTEAIERPLWFWMMVLTYAGWVLRLAFKPDGAWHAWPRQAQAAVSCRLTLDLAAQRLVAEETYLVQTERNRESSLPLSALRFAFRHVKADPGSDLTDSHSLYLELKPGASLGMAWADWQLQCPLHELRHDESADAALQALAQRTGIDVVP